MIFGFFDSPAAVVPAYDPGLNVPCPVCNDLFQDAMKSLKSQGIDFIALKWHESAGRYVVPEVCE